MTFDRPASETLYNRLHTQVADGEIDGETVLDACDQLQFAWERVTQLEARVAQLENECRSVGTF